MDMKGKLRKAIGGSEEHTHCNSGDGHLLERGGFPAAAAASIRNEERREERREGGRAVHMLGNREEVRCNVYA